MRARPALIAPAYDEYGLWLAFPWGESFQEGDERCFDITDCDVLGQYAILWKVRNQGPEAIQRSELRGEITWDKNGMKEKNERTSFPGDHYVEVYAVKDRVCVARERIAVPI